MDLHGGNLMILGEQTQLSAPGRSYVIVPPPPPVIAIVHTRRTRNGRAVLGLVADKGRTLADSLKTASVDDLAAIVWPAAEAWFNNKELLALQEIIDRFRAAAREPSP